MKESTRQEYVRLGAHFVKTVKEQNSDLGHIPPSLYLDALKERAGKTTPAYWRRLKTGYAEWCFNEGYSKQGNNIKKIKNPVTEKGFKNMPDETKARKKAKVIKNDDFMKLFEAADDATKATMIAIHQLGVRPAEIEGIEHIAGDRFFIKGVKTNAEGNRGLDRILKIDNEKGVRNIINAIGILNREANEKNISVGEVVGRVRKRFDRLAVKTFPRRKLKVCLYSIRHQYGSDLKASDLSREEMAYIMGHQSTKSIERYGDRRSGRSGGAGVRADEKGWEKKIRANHNAPDSARTYQKSRDNDRGLGY